LVPPLRDLLRPLWAMKPFENQPAFAPLYAPGFWLVAIGVVVVLTARVPLARVIAKSARSAWRACAVTLVFVVMAELYVGSGMAQQIAQVLQAAVGREAALGVPAFAAIGGFLTGGGSAANAMLMPMVTALARALALDSSWVAAIQNSLCTNLTMLSPIRISMGAAILGLKVADAELYRRTWPLALPPMITGFAAVALLLAASAV
jgi:lactate permease